MTFKNIELMKQKKAAMVNESRGLTERAEKENRDLTQAEKNRLDTLLKDVRALADEIETEERSQQLEMAANGPKNPRNIVLTEEDRTFLRFVREGMGGLDRSERRALVEDSTGQYLVTPAVETELQRAVADLVIVRQLASKKTLNGADRINVRDITEATVDWGKLELGTEIEESIPIPSPATKYVEDLYGLVKIGEDELMDSDYNLFNYVVDTFARAIAEKENLGFLKGTGHTYSQPEGICTNATLLSQAKTTAAAGAVTIEDFMQCIYEVPPKYRQGSAWIVNSTTELEIRKLRAELGEGIYGNFLWQPSLIEGRPNTFLGYPIYNQDDMDDLSDTGGVIAIFGNFQYGYRILDRMGTTIQRLNELYAEAGLVGFKVHARVGGYVMRPTNKALVLLKEHSA